MAGPSPQQPNAVGNASLVMGILSLALVFGGLCGLVGLRQGWLPIAGTVLFVCGASSAFLGFLGVVLGVAGLLGAGRSRVTPIVGLVMGWVSRGLSVPRRPGSDEVICRRW